MEEIKITPMIRQYLEIKEKHRDAILFFRLGDFYEMFFEDAERASRLLDITLTSRNRQEETPIPLCGVPYHAAAPYIGKLLDAGYKVAICEQVEDPKAAKGVVQREVVRVITPGTVTDEEALIARDNNFLAAVNRGSGDYGLAVTDVTTGEFRFTRCADIAAVVDELARIRPREVIVAEAERSLATDFGREFSKVHWSCVPSLYFSRSAVERLRTMGLWSEERDQEWESGIEAAAAILAFLEESLPEARGLLRRLEPYSSSQSLMIDETTRRNLELLRNLQGETKGSLLGVLDSATTPMGARRLRQWILYPLLDDARIRERQDAVEELTESYVDRRDLRSLLGGIQDLERLGTRVVAGSARPPDLVALKRSLRAIGPLRAKLEMLRAEIFAALRNELCDLTGLADLIERAIADDPPATARERGIIRDGYDADLDEIRAVQKDAKSWIARFEEAERKRTGIHSLKVRYNKVFGYYIEVTKSNLKLVPPDYLRKQTLVNGERYITPELKETEAKVLSSEEEIVKLEAALFTGVREKAAAYYDQIKQIGCAVATADVLASLAETASSCHFVRPCVDQGAIVTIRGGRHPVVEQAIGRGAFVPNDCHMDPEGQQILILTGPNMAGKSTYMRQVALIVILAQMGSFVPAAEARIGVVDRIFTRIGATDSLACGESTFMVEMRETAHILRHATARSLILLDEVGRGTSTFDGISIAWSVGEHLHDGPNRPRTLFATHYHELTDLALTKERVKNFHFSVKEWKGEVIFLRNLTPGASSRSYGIHVARLAGLPATVVQRAKEIFGNLEGGELDEHGRPRLAGRGPDQGPAQMSLFYAGDHELREKLTSIDATTLTPVEALNLLYELSERAKKEGG